MIAPICVGFYEQHWGKRPFMERDQTLTHFNIPLSAIISLYREKLFGFYPFLLSSRLMYLTAEGMFLMDLIAEFGISISNSSSIAQIS